MNRKKKKVRYKTDPLEKGKTKQNKKPDPLELLELKNTVSEMKNPVCGLNSILDMQKKRSAIG